jgi:hypothetical protein
MACSAPTFGRPRLSLCRRQPRNSVGQWMRLCCNFGQARYRPVGSNFGRLKFTAELTARKLERELALSPA